MENPSRVVGAHGPRKTPAGGGLDFVDESIVRHGVELRAIKVYCAQPEIACGGFRFSGADRSGRLTRSECVERATLPGE
jgi:hypothetical protein